jgi:hypothetical protein
MFSQVMDNVVSDLAGSRLLDHLVDLDELECTHSLADAEARIAARVRLYQFLITDGWQPPARVLVQLARDEALLALPRKDSQR